MNPTPNVLSQLLIAGPIIIMYQVGIGLIALINRQRSETTAEPEHLRSLTFEDTRRVARYMIRRTLRAARPSKPKGLVDGVIRA
jgi:hypothetical protein